MKFARGILIALVAGLDATPRAIRPHRVLRSSIPSRISPDAGPIALICFQTPDAVP